jgi:4-hydroxy-2-oxoheptanedioate aldolase
MSLRDLWESGEATIGGWCGIPNPFSAELMGRCGFDWICIDMQHGLVGYEQMTVMLQTLAITDTPAFVRVPWNQPDHIMKALDAGAQGIIVPMVGTADEARAAVDSVKYPPLGHRSWGPVRAALGVNGYSPEVGNRRTILAVMIETPDGIANLDDILSVPGVDAAYVGPSDLALGHGMTPTLAANDPEHERLIMAVLDGCRRNDVVAGIHCDGVDTVNRWRERGYRMLTLANDASLMRKAATEALATLRAQAPAAAPTTSNYA